MHIFMFPIAYWPWDFPLLSSVLLPIGARRELRAAAHLLLPCHRSKAPGIFLKDFYLATSLLRVTARNIFRHKQRMFMTIGGVAGSVALPLRP